MMGWDGARVATLCAYWRDGYSGRQIGKLMGGITRSAVLGKIHRLRVERRDLVVVRGEPYRPGVDPRPDWLQWSFARAA